MGIFQKIADTKESKNITLSLHLKEVMQFEYLKVNKGIIMPKIQIKVRKVW